MSGKVMGYVFEIQDLSLAEKIVLLAYADNAHHDGTSIFPSVETVALKASCSERTVQRCKKSLIERGYLVKEGKHRSGTDLLRIPVPNYEGGDRVTPPNDNGVTDSQKGVTESALGGDIAVSPDPSLTVHEPSIKDINHNGGISKYILCDLLGYPEEEAEHFEKAVEQKRIEFGVDEERMCQLAYEEFVKFPETERGYLFQQIERRVRIGT